jgi:hypothetical protein
MLSLLIAGALAAEEPCYGHDWETRIEGEHVWVEWDPDILNEEAAGFLLGFVEDAWDIYQQQGWEMPHPSVVVTVLPDSVLSSGSSGACRTHACDEGPLPKIEIFEAAYNRSSAAPTSTHELGHAVQYSYMGDTTGAVGAWSWWMEGCATWMEMRSERDDSWQSSVDAYLANPHLRMHHNALSLGVDGEGPHMYGSAMLAFYIEAHWGVEGVIGTWEYGQDHAGEAIWFPDAAESASGLPFDEFWAQYLAEVAVQDIDAPGLNKLPLPERTRNVSFFPASGSTSDVQNLGFEIVRFNAETGAPGSLLTIDLSFDDIPDKWHAVLAKATSTGKKSELLSFEVIEDGSITTEHDGEAEVFLIVSPEVTGDPNNSSAFTWSWDADNTVLSGEEPDGCGCHSGVGGTWASALLMLIATRRRHR